jgi:hypothetical protein
MDPANPFRDWLSAPVYDGTWVTVGGLGGWLGPASLPVLFTPGAKETMLASTEWPMQIDEAGPEVWEWVGGSHERSRHASLYPERHHGDVPIEPLAAYFNPPDRRSWLEPIQAFVLYFGASPKHSAGGRISWEVRDEDGRPEEIARWTQVGGNQETGGTLEIRRDRLFKFMREFDFDLAIYFEENRAVDGVDEDWRDSEREANRYWRAWASRPLDEIRAVLRCVTVLERPSGLDQDPENAAHGQTLEYIIGTDPGTGEPIMTSYPGGPHEKTVWEGAGGDNFLTPVFFRREVLDYYLSDPLHYEVSSTQVSAGGMWRIPIAITERGNVQVWLGDLGRISDRAQRHWHQFNIPDDDDVPEWRRRRDLYAEWVETPRDAGVEKLREAIDRVNEVALQYSGAPLYAPVTALNEQRMRSLHQPLNNSEPAFQHQVTSLAILVADHLNSDFFSAVEAPMGSAGLNRLAEWLESVLSVSREEARDMIGGLYAVQAIRSSAGGAHRAGDRTLATLERAGIDPHALPAGFEQLAVRAAEAIDRVREAITGLPPRT